MNIAWQHKEAAKIVEGLDEYFRADPHPGGQQWSERMRTWCASKIAEALLLARQSRNISERSHHYQPTTDQEQRITLLEQQNAALRAALRNIFVLSNRELSRLTRKEITQERAKEMWGHVHRLCVEVGCESSILRVADPQQGVAE